MHPPDERWPLSFKSALRPFLVLKELKGIPAFSGNFGDIPENSWESSGNGTCVPRKGFCFGCVAGE